MSQSTVSELVEQPIFGASDLVANIGGYLGLCLGASMLSMYEFGIALIRRVVKSTTKITHHKEDHN